MPSLHTAYALTVGVTGFLVCTSLLARLLWTIYPALVVYSIVATGNHFVLDAVAGAGVAGLALLGALAIARGRTPRFGRDPVGFLVPRSA
jgi:membrane-associated phospholipid phosphatase